MTLVLPSRSAVLLTAVLATAAQGSATAFAGLIYSSLGQTIGENFDSLVGTGGTLANNTTGSWSNNSTLPGWYAAKANGDTFTSYTVFDGSTVKGNVLMSLGNQYDSDRALGFQTYQSGNVDVHYGLRLLNNTGIALNEFTLGYQGEQWRRVSNADRIVFDYQVFESGSGILNAATGWTNVGSLEFLSPQTGNPGVGLDGNAAANSAQLSATVRGFSWEPDQELWLRWTDLYTTYQTLAIDDVSFSAIPEPGSALMMLMAGLAGLMVRRRRRS